MPVGGGGAHVPSTPNWRPPRGLRGLAGLRGDAPSEARGADVSRAGRPRGGRKSGGGQARRRPENQRGHALWRWGELKKRLLADPHDPA